MTVRAPWQVVQFNEGRDWKYKPVEIHDRDGKIILRVGDGDDSLPLARFIVKAANAAMQETLMKEIEETIDRLKSNGWTKQDFADALKAMLEEN